LLCRSSWQRRAAATKWLVAATAEWGRCTSIWCSSSWRRWHEEGFGKVIYTVVQKNVTPFSFHCGFYKRWPISIIFSTWYTELICTTTIYIYSPHLHIADTQPLETFDAYIFQYGVHVRRSSYWSVKIRSSFLHTLWPQDSANLNEVGYWIWSVMQYRVYQTPVQEVANPRQRVIDTHCKLVENGQHL